MSDFTVMLSAVQEGRPQAAEELLRAVYDELRKLAAYRMAQQPPGQTLQPTALVHEAWLKLVGSNQPSFEDRGHFFAAAAEAMRHILIDRARRKLTRRHGGNLERVDADEFELVAPMTDQQLLDLHEALDRFTGMHPVQAQVVKLRFFVGMNHEEIAQLLGISVSTVKNYWNYSRAWLYRDLGEEI
ncbi:sigma-70 family RNA polymerase sigma factor [Luteolibacter arcticus]|uniref:Sigma-70 family RNA polymerase sigma factor n=1 Tax=Luteolibacter arcticus TaxID=1581411 RepID=A0ABT3GQS2_9BACT|nr:sigma-70 family RNA polymerase sigma factor [Luteolibacter arcticus]MCW1925874.1 sigma-70 family RNA polymerase sigma factor [Luteolibacter arcticus]